MQGSYKNNGLPRPYYMKPATSKKFSPYDKMPNMFFNSNRRKFVGYMLMLFLFGTCMFFISQDLKPSPDPVYEIINANEIDNADFGNKGTKVRLAASLEDSDRIGNIANSIKNADQESENDGLAKNLAQGSKGDIGHGVAEAPKGGIANEAPMVGTNADIVIGQGKGNTDANGKVKSYRNGGESEKEQILKQPAYEKGERRSADDTVRKIVGQEDDFHVKGKDI